MEENKNISVNCQNCKKDFNITEDDKSFYERMSVPYPTFCPMCRMIRRLAFRNQRKLFKADNAFTGEKIFSLVPPDANIPIITEEQWHEDSWDGIDFGVDVDFSVSFLIQLFDLRKKIPQGNLNCTRMVNSSYSGNAEDLKNCYMIFNASVNENCLYGTGYYNSKYCVDNCDIYDSEFCYMNFSLENCNKVYFSEECNQCADVWFSKNCVGCLNCIGCVNLRNKSYNIFNVQYDKDTYYKEIEKLGLDTHKGIEEMKIKSFQFWQKYPKKYYQGTKNLNCTGVYVTNSKNVNESYLVTNAENIKYSQYISQPPNKDCYDITIWGNGSELAYEYSSSGTGIYNSKFLVDCWPNIRNTEYSISCKSSSHLFGCVGLKNKEYCILNKQYEKEEYFMMVEKMKKHMDEMPYIDKNDCVYKYGEFFPIEFSWYGYNNTIVQEFYPLTKEEALDKGYPWYETPGGDYDIDLTSNDLPETPNEIPDDICTKVISCSDCLGAYKFQTEEVSFLKREKIPLPHQCPECRYKAITKNRLKPNLYNGKCMKEGCEEKFQTGFSPESGAIVYCEKCYQQEVI